MANARCTATTKPRHLLAKAAEQMSSPSTSHSEARTRRTTSLFFFPNGVMVGWDITLHNVLYTLAHGNEASQSHNGFEAPTQRETNLQVSRMGQHCTLGIKVNSKKKLDLISVYSTLTTIGGKSDGEDRTLIFPKRHRALRLPGIRLFEIAHNLS